MKIKRYHSQTEFVGQQAVNLLQNISINRANKRISKTDLQNVFAMANLSAYPGTSMYFKGSGHEFAHAPYMILRCVKGVGNGQAKTLWMVFIHSGDPSGTKPSSTYYLSTTETGYENYPSSIVHDKYTATAATNIYKDLSIQQDEKKILVETAFLYRNYYGNVNGTIVSIRQALNLHLTDVTCHPYIGSAAIFCCNSVVIFTPKPGLFDESHP